MTQAATISTAVEEMARWVSPIRNMTRHATVDVELGGRHIAAGDKLLQRRSNP
jgi:cytochrome P450